MTGIDIPALIPHAGAMCLLADVITWTADTIECCATSHLDPANPLRRGGQLSTVAGIEYALQAAALHGALRGGAPQRPGYLANLRLEHIAPGRLDDPSLGDLTVQARREHGDTSGLLYAIRVTSAATGLLVDGRATIILAAGARG